MDQPNACKKRFWWDTLFWVGLLSAPLLFTVWLVIEAIIGVLNGK